MNDNAQAALWHDPLTLLQRALFYALALALGALAALELGAALEAPLARGAAQVRTALRHVAAVGAILVYSFVNEHTSALPRVGKSYSHDLFWFLAALLLLAALLTLKPSRGGGAVLNRDQTEEWKGWMQFLFIMYHQQHAVDVYNLIRVFVSAYVWMTGFGNFSFFYVRADYSFNRFIKMLWRLNFLVLAIMAMMGTNYILYYIVPLHTFYFLTVLATMGIYRSINYTEWGPRVKIFVVACIIFVVWELEQHVDGIFDIAFAVVRPIVGESDGSLHEWHFRTFLDHYSTLFGMIFAMNFPYLQAWFVAVEKLPTTTCVALKSLVAAFWLGLMYWWYHNIYTLPKFEFNAAHPYWFWIPILSYIYFRNITLTFRSYHSSLLNWIGKITLETYLLQFHVFMRAHQEGKPWKPEMLLALVPGYPMCNLLLTGLLFVCCAKLAFNATLTLRDIVIGDATPTDVVRALPYILAATLGTLLFAAVFNFNDDILIGTSIALAVAGFVATYMFDWEKL